MQQQCSDLDCCGRDNSSDCNNSPCDSHRDSPTEDTQRQTVCIAREYSYFTSVHLPHMHSGLLPPSSLKWTRVLMMLLEVTMKW